MFAIIGAQSGHGLGPAIMLLNSLGDHNHQLDGMAAVGGLVESQTKARFSTRIAPDGSAWAPWSEAYAGSRRRGQSLLVESGHLRDDIHWEIAGDELRIGSGLVYAAIHQAGGQPGMAPGPAAIPAREYLGLSPQDVIEITDALEGWIGGLDR